MAQIGRVAAYSAACLILAGCASGQLNYNALDLAGSIDDLLTSQVVFNLARFLDNPNGTPAQVSIGAGSVSTTNQASLSLLSPLTTAVTTTNTAVTGADAVLPIITRSASGFANAFTLTPSATNQATQNWSLTTDSDSGQERRLRALYRYAIEAIGWKELCREYSLISTNLVPAQSLSNTLPPTTQPSLDGEFLREPGCIICSKGINMVSISTLKHHRYCPGSRDLYVNPRLRQGWLVAIRADADSPGGLMYIGRHRDYVLYTRDPEQFHQFVLFILEATNLGQSGKPAGPARTINGPAGPTFVLPRG
jgi:hypothetical protein